MKIKLITFGGVILFMAAAGKMYAENENDETGGRYAGMSFTSISVQDPWGVMNNQAGFASIDKITSGIYYENRFMIKETGYRSAIFILPTGSGNLGVGISNFGFSEYNKSLIGLAFAKMFGNQFAAGIKLNYFLLKYGKNYPSSNCISFEAGIQTKLTGQLTMGVHISNPLSIHINSELKDKIPPLLRIGISYLVTDKIIISIQADKDVYHAVNFRCGTELEIVDRFFIRAGLTTKPFTNSFGAGFGWKRLSLDIAGHMHYILGYTMVISLQYSVN